MPRITPANVEEIFSYHPPNGKQVGQYAMINTACKQLAITLISTCPEGRELSIALTHLQELRMMANAAIALEHIPD